MTTTASPIHLIAAREERNAARSARAGHLVRVLAGIYAPSSEWVALAPWDRYLARVHAAILTYPDSTLCLESAAALHGLPTFGDPGIVHLLAGDSSRSRLGRGIRLHTSSQHRDLQTVNGTLVTSVADTVVDHARLRHEAIGLAIADAALRRSPILQLDDLIATNNERSSSRGRRHARWALTRASSLAESPLESVDRAVIEWLGFPDPHLQVWIGSDRVDKWWPGYSIAGESDGDLKYDGRHGDPRAALRDRHERDARLFRRGARAVPHWGWAEAIAAEPLAAILTSAGLPLVAPRDSARLHTLRRAL